MLDGGSQSGGKGGSSSSSGGGTTTQTGCGSSLGDLNAYGGGTNDSVQLKNKAEHILGIIQAIGVVVSVIMLMVIGIKYMLGSVEERAEYKETLKPYLIGAFMLFSCTTVPQIIYQIVKNF